MICYVPGGRRVGMPAMTARHRWKPPDRARDGHDIGAALPVLLVAALPLASLLARQ